MSNFANPEAKTGNLFNREVEDLDLVLPGMFVNLGDGSKLRIDKTEPWFKDDKKEITRTDLRQIKVIHRPGIERLQAGDIWIHPLRFGINQTIVAAQDRGVVGACIRVTGASGAESRSDTYETLRLEGDIARFLIVHGGLQSKWVGSLRFLDVLDDELSLQVLGPFEDVSKRRLSFDDANKALNDFFIEV